MNDADIIEVVTAHLEGKKIQHRRIDAGSDAEWKDCKDDPLWNFSYIDYRVKPEPQIFYIRKSDIKRDNYNLDCYTEQNCSVHRELYIKAIEILDND